MLRAQTDTNLIAISALLGQHLLGIGHRCEGATLDGRNLMQSEELRRLGSADFLCITVPERTTVAYQEQETSTLFGLSEYP